MTKTTHTHFEQTTRDTRHVAHNAAINAVLAVYTADNVNDAREMLANHLTAAFSAGCVRCAADAVAKELVWEIAKGLAADGEFIGSYPGEFVAEMNALICLKRRQRRDQAHNSDLPF